MVAFEQESPMMSQSISMKFTKCCRNYFSRSLFSGIDLQRRSIAKAVCLQKLKELKETADFQAKFIDRLMLDKENSLR